MAIKTLNYLDIAPDARKKAGVRRLTQLRQVLSDRSLPPEYRKRVEDEVKLVNAWIAGTAKPLPAPAPEPTPQPGVPVGNHHVIEVKESLSVED